MMEVLYEFEKIHSKTQSNYIFQYVKNRRLTDIYHSHDFYEIIYCLQGSAIQLVNDYEIGFEPNSIMLLRPEDRHCFIKQTDNIIIVSLSVRGEEFEMFSNAYAISLLNWIHSSPEPQIYVKAFLLPYTGTEFENIALNNKEYDFKFLLSCFLKFYMECSEENCTRLPQWLSCAINEMKKTENLRRGIPAFTELANFSQSQLSRYIKKYFGISLKQYINELRLQTAYSNIILTQKSAEVISEELGFTSYSHFNKIFKTRFLVTPVALRKQNGIQTI